MGEKVWYRRWIDPRGPYWHVRSLLIRGVLIDVRGHLEARAPYWRAASWQAWADQGRKHVFENYGKDNIKSC